MRLFTKYFLFGMLVLGLAFSASGYFLLRYSMESSLAREVDFALKQYQYDKFTVQSATLSYSEVLSGWTVGDSVSDMIIWKNYPEENDLPEGDVLSQGQSGEPIPDDSGDEDIRNQYR